MTYKEVVEKVRKEFGNADVSNYEDHLAIQFNVTGEGEGAFYVEIIDGNLKIEEFDYINNNAQISAAADNIIDIFSGKLDMNNAVDSGKIEVSGDYAKALSIQPVIDKNQKIKNNDKKTAEKKPAAKKSTASKKTSAKPTTKAAAKKATTKKESK